MSPARGMWSRLREARFERTGHPDEAVGPYEDFAVGWAAADPELQPRIEEARAAAEGHGLAVGMKDEGRGYRTQSGAAAESPSHHE